MAKINDLISKIDNPDLRLRIEQEVAKMQSHRKFGLVFEEHLPECTPLFDIPVKRGATVALKTGKISENYVVTKIDGDKATCEKLDGTHTVCEFAVDDFVVVAQFGEPIYPFLKKIDSVQNAPDSDLWHTLIEADNYHALQLLFYLYAGQVDCIYIDPPYNTGARDWKYNNDYVDSSDAYRHSKWLSMMQKRLQLAKKLLNPKDSVLIVTIDEKEYLHLGCLLEQLFPDASGMQMVSIVNNNAGTGRSYEFARVNEYAFFIRLGESGILPEYTYGGEHKSVLWDVLRRSELANIRPNKKTQFFPIFIDDLTGKIHSVGDPITPDVDINTIIPPTGCTAVFPIRDDGIETSWSCKKEEMMYRIEKGYIKVGKKTPNKPQKYSLTYIKTGAITDIENGKAVIEGYNKDGSVQAFYNDRRKKNPPTILSELKYDARPNGSNLLNSIVGEKRFDYPKSLYAVEDCLRFVIADNPNALVVDFFAGSGTTLHAVNLLNAEDGGHRRCILVTNNEVSDEESKTLTKQGYKPGDDEWEKLGIARYVTWPRTVCSIEGHDVNGNPLKGNYIDSELPMEEGFKANAVYFKLGFLNKTNVSLGREFARMLSLLWMKAGAHGICPEIEGNGVPDMLVYPENRFAVLNAESAFNAFANEVNSHPEIETVFIITDSENAYKEMIRDLDVRRSFQLYRDYLDNFRINQNR